MSKLRFPNESDEYRTARDELLAAEVDLRDRIERVAAMRRALPLGGAVAEDYVFEELVDDRVREVRLSELFEPGKETLFLYAFMFGPQMKEPCVMCTSILDGLDGAAPHIRRRVNLAVAARSPIRRIREFTDARGWKNLRLLSDEKNGYHADYFALKDGRADYPMANVFVRRDGAVHHFWGSEMLYREFPDGDARHVDLLWPVYNLIDLTPEGRGDFYPALRY